MILSRNQGGNFSDYRSEVSGCWSGLAGHGHRNGERCQIGQQSRCNGLNNIRILNKITKIKSYLLQIEGCGRAVVRNEFLW